MAIDQPVRCHLLQWLGLACMLPLAGACHAAPHDRPPARGEQAPMAVDTAAPDPATSGTEWTANNKLARLHGRFSLDDDARMLHIAYTVENIGAYPLLVFDRGDALSVGTKRQVSGSVGVPTTRFDAGDLTLSHTARPLPQPTPTVPPSPLVTQILPGETYRNQWSQRLPESGPDAVRRVRYCQGAIGVPEPLAESDRREGGIWSVPNAFAEHQGVLCSPWFEVATARLAKD